MSFKLILLSFVIFVVACGVKGPPRHPAGSDIKPLLYNYISPVPSDEVELDDDKKKEQQ